VFTVGDILAGHVNATIRRFVLPDSDRAEAYTSSGRITNVIDANVQVYHSDDGSIRYGRRVDMPNPARQQPTVAVHTDTLPPSLQPDDVRPATAQVTDTLASVTVTPAPYRRSAVVTPVDFEALQTRILAQYPRAIRLRQTIRNRGTQ